jgi:hypothetical protein
MGAEEAAAEAGHPGVSCAQGAQRQLSHVQLGGPREEGLPPTGVRVLRQKPAQEEEEVQYVAETCTARSHTKRPWRTGSPG